jgi:hypothetical protein
MPAARLKLVVEQGATFAKAFRLKKKDGTAFDLTGATVTGRIKVSHTATEVLATFTMALASDPTTGVFTARLTAAQTSALACDPPYKLGVYTIKVTSGGVTTRILEGDAELSPDV